MKLSDMREVLAQRQIQLTKSLGQNFLHDGNQLRRIVEAAALSPADQVLEIGPGLGPLTERLLLQAGSVFAIEKDGRLVDYLCARFGLADGLADEARSGSAASEEVSNLTLLHDDALGYLKRERRDWSAWKLVANLPYSVASPILVELAQASGCPQRLVVTLQLEVAKRLMATVQDEDYGLLTLLVQLRYEPGEWFKIPADCFFPAPEVDSACVVLTRRATPLLPLADHPTFEKIIRRAFSQRRKMMFKLLKQDWPVEQLQRAFAALNLSLKERGEKLSLAQFVALTQFLIASR